MSLGSFMTTFTPPAGCLGTNLYWVKTSTVASSSTTSQYYWLSGEPFESSCFPSGYAPEQSRYFTPATACPGSYTPACTKYATAGQYTETQIRCCPSFSEGSFTCKTTKASYDNPWGSSLECMTILTTDTSTSFVTLKSTRAGTETAGAATAAAGTVLAYAVYIRYVDSDLTTTTSATATATTGTGTSGATATAGSTTSYSSHSGLSSGAAAGIGVGVGIAGLAVIAVMAYLFWSRRRKQVDSPDQGPPNNNEGQQPGVQETPKWTNAVYSPDRANPNDYQPYASTMSPQTAFTAYTQLMPEPEPEPAPAELPAGGWVHEAPGHTAAVEKDAAARPA